MNNIKERLYWLTVVLLLILGILLRTNLFLHMNVFEDDECRLTLAILDKSYWGLFSPLHLAQSAPPIFTILSKFIGNLSNYNETMMKFIPYASSIGSIFVFYKLLNTYFKKRLPVLFGIFIFSVAEKIINFSTIFKQYSTDVLIGLLCLYYLPKINIKNLTMKKLSALVISLIILPLISLPSIFFIGAFFVQNIIKNYNNKEFYKKLLIIVIPFITTMLLYYFFKLVPEKINMDLYFPTVWNDGFIQILSIKSFIKIFAMNIGFLFFPNKFILPIFLMIIWGIVRCIIDKNNISKFILTVLLLTIFASTIRIYPLLSRVSLYITPILLILAIKPIEDLSYKTKSYWAAILALIIGFSGYNLTYLKNIIHPNYFIPYSPQVLMTTLQNKYNPETDIILINSASFSSFLFYSSKLNFQPQKYVLMNNNINTALANLPQNVNIWIYFIKDYSQAKIKPELFAWLKKQHVLYQEQNLQSYLFYIKH